MNLQLPVGQYSTSRRSDRKSFKKNADVVDSVQRTGQSSYWFHLSIGATCARLYIDAALTESFHNEFQWFGVEWPALDEWRSAAVTSWMKAQTGQKTAL
jgi:hypothetical protein